MGDPRLIEVPGGAVEVLDRGPRDGIPFVFHHGGSAGLGALPPNVDLDELGIRAITFARPGYNGSTRRPGRSVADTVTRLEVVLDRLGVGAFITAGWSAGGPHALGCSALLGERCRATAVIAGVVAPAAGELFAEWLALLEAGLPVRASDGSFERALEERAEVWSQFTVEQVRALYTAAADRSAIEGEFGEWLTHALGTAFTAGIGGGADDLRALVADWGFEVADAHTVSVWQGTQDAMPDGNPDWFAGRIPGTLVHLVDEGHASVLLHLPAIVEELTRRGGLR